jgi:tetratricopeptide (TPR) repeat protein
VKDAPPISDDKPRIEFSAPHNLVIPVQYLWFDNMTELLNRRVSVLPCLASADSAATAGIVRCEEASTLIMKAELLDVRQQFLAAEAAADSSLVLMPRDTTAAMVRQEATGNAVQWFLNGARGFRSLGLLLQSEQAYLRALAADSLCAPAHTELATLYSTLGNGDMALEHARKAVTSSPDDPAMHTNLAVVYMNLNRPSEAEAELLRAVGGNETCGRAHYFLAMLYRETGRIVQAQAAMRRARELGYVPQPQ